VSKKRKVVARLLAPDPAALDADRISGEREADRSDAGEGRRRPAIGNQAVLAVRQFPEIAESALFEIVEPPRQRRAGRGKRRDRQAGRRSCEGRARQ
jgi:hypothetical protein